MYFDEIQVVEERWPGTRKWSLKQTAELLGLQDSLLKIKQDHNNLENLKKAKGPIIGVAGLVNSGKSSFVKSFLSRQGAQRVLCGEHEENGTQRFVLWMPEKWYQNSCVFEILKEQLESIYGSSYEYLHTSPDRAHAQYNGGGQISERFTTPLIAFDSGLNEYGFALLDCPDFEREHPGIEGHNSAGFRRNILEKSSKLMSAVVVIADRPQVSGGSLEKILDDIPSLKSKPKFFLINMIKPKEKIHALYDDKGIKKVMDSLSISDIYIAYDYHANNAENFIPDSFNEYGSDINSPVFFKVDKIPYLNQRNYINDERHIIKSMQGLDGTELLHRHIEETNQNLENNIDEIKKSVEEILLMSEKKIERMKKCLIDIVNNEIFKYKDISFYNKSAETQIYESIKNTAPIWAKPLMYQSNVNSKLRESWKKINLYLNPKRWIQKELNFNLSNSILKNKKVITPENLTIISRDYDFMPKYISGNQINEAWTKVLKSIEYAEVKLDENILEEFGKTVWNNMNKMQKTRLVTATPASLVLGLGSLAFIPFDLGASSAIYIYTVPEVATAAGIGILTSNLSARKLNSVLQKDIYKQIKDVIKVNTLDTFGLPRENNKSFYNISKNPVSVNLAQNCYLGSIITNGWCEVKNKLIKENRYAK